MRIRPFCWGVLLMACLSTLFCAALYQHYDPSFLQVQIIQQHLVTKTPATIEVHVTDLQGIPIDKAQIIPQARMTNMQMTADKSSVEWIGHGQYQVKFLFSMGGPWSITLQTRATGYAPQKQTLLVQLQC
ncbi:MAG TPA: FixH family protein [Dictyobacter sp.]|jgi:hypothetical protein|nr:FixH family protein [Dictyobacter sp.]